MDGRVVAVLLLLVAPAILIAVTIEDFSANPLAILGELTWMIGGFLYLLTYREAF